MVATGHAPPTKEELLEVRNEPVFHDLNFAPPNLIHTFLRRQLAVHLPRKPADQADRSLEAGHRHGAEYLARSEGESLANLARVREHVSRPPSYQGGCRIFSSPHAQAAANTAVVDAAANIRLAPGHVAAGSEFRCNRRAGGIVTSDVIAWATVGGILVTAVGHLSVGRVDGRHSAAPEVARADADEAI